MHLQVAQPNMVVRLVLLECMPEWRRQVLHYGLEDTHRNQPISMPQK